MVDFANTIFLNSAQIIAVLLLCAAIIWFNRLEYALAIYVSTPLWTRSIQIGPVAHTWVFLTVMVCAAVMYNVRRKKPLLHPQFDTWILFWFLLWYLWMMILVLISFPSEENNLLHSLLLYLLIPLPFIYLVAQELKRIKRFAIAFIVTTIIGGIMAFNIINISLAQAIADPTLLSFGILRLNIINYHWFSYDFVISLIFIVTLFRLHSNLFIRLLLAAAAMYCIYLLLLLGSRQAMAGAALSMLLFLLIVAARSRQNTIGVLLLVVSLIALGVAIFVYAPELVLRSYESDVSQSFDLEARRGEYWQLGWNIFLSSPVWGSGFRDFIAHNLFIGTLAEQGFVGLVFLLGFFTFCFKQIVPIFQAPIDDERTIWGIAFSCVIIFGIIHSQVSGSAVSVWHFYWSAIVIWILRTSLAKNAHPSQLRTYESAYGFTST